MQTRNLKKSAFLKISDDLQRNDNKDRFDVPDLSDILEVKQSDFPCSFLFVSEPCFRD